MESASTELTFKTPTTLETIPEDIAEIIAAKIKDWAKVGGTLEQREKARKMRDSALRAVAFTCRKSHQVFQPALLENVTLDFRHFFSFCLALQGSQEYGHSIKFLTLDYRKGISKEEQDMMNSHLSSLSEVGLVSRDPTDHARVSNGFLQCKALVFQRLVSIQNLVIMHNLFSPRSFKDLSCFPTSLKRLHLPLVSPSKEGDGEFNAKNVIWVLTFGSLEEFCVGCTISASDFGYLYEHHQAFEGTSNVKKLSLWFSFVSQKSDRRTWWRTSRGREMDMKTEALRLLLSSVIGLECLELFPSFGGKSNFQDEALLSLDHLFNLEESLGSLRHLRLFNFSWFKPAEVLFPLYLCLKTISLERNLLHLLVKLNRLKLPSSLERLVLTCYLISSDAPIAFQEEHLLAQVLTSQALPKLKEVLVPSALIDPDGKVHGAEDSKERKMWADRRKQLEDDPIFKSGKVKLRKFSPGEMSR